MNNLEKDIKNHEVAVIILCSPVGDIGQSNIFNVVSKLVHRIEALEVDNQNMANKIKRIDEKLDQIVSSDKSEEESSVTAITPSAATESGK